MEYSGVGQNNGQILCQMPTKPAKAIHSNSDFVIIGSEDGEIMVWQCELSERRLNSTETNNQTNNEHRKSMKDKLGFERALILDKFSKTKGLDNLFIQFNLTNFVSLLVCPENSPID